MDRIERINKRVKEHYEYLEQYIKDNKLECEIFGLFLQGSQNYNLDEYSDEYMSDIDTKAIVVPSLKDIILNKTYSATVVLPNNEHIDVKDIQTMIDMFKKQNTSYIELLFTDFFIINQKYLEEYKLLDGNKEQIARINPFRFVKAVEGSLNNKFKAMTHKSPHSEAVIERLGYDPKELCHIIRYHSELKRYIENKGKSFKEYLLGESKEYDEYLMKVKKGLAYNKDEAYALADRLNNETKEIADKYTTETVDCMNMRVVDILIDTGVRCLTKRVKDTRE